MRRWSEWKPAFEFEPERAGLLVVDMQNGFLEPGGPLAVPRAVAQVPRIQRLIAAFRGAQRPVLFTQFCVGRDFNYPFYWAMARQRGLRLEPPDCQFWADTHEAAIAPALQPRPDEPVIQKCGYDAFAETTLDADLRSRGVDTLVIAGTVVNWCVDSTVRAAFHRRYQVVVAADAVSGYDHAGLSGEMWERAELDLFAEAFGRVLQTEQILGLFRPPGGG